MYENILHKPLVLRPGISLTAWSILEELLEKDRQSRLGAREDFVCNVLTYQALLHLKGHHQIYVHSTGLIVGDRLLCYVCFCFLPFYFFIKDTSVVQSLKVVGSCHGI